MYVCMYKYVCMLWEFNIISACKISTCISPHNLYVKSNAYICICVYIGICKHFVCTIYMFVDQVLSSDLHCRFVWLYYVCCSYVCAFAWVGICSYIAGKLAKYLLAREGPVGKTKTFLKIFKKIYFLWCNV